MVRVKGTLFLVADDFLGGARYLGTQLSYADKFIGFFDLNRSRIVEGALVSETDDRIEWLRAPAEDGQKITFRKIELEEYKLKFRALFPRAPEFEDQAEMDDWFANLGWGG